MIDAHLRRMKDVQTSVNEWYKAGRVSIRDALATDYYAADAELLLVETKGK